MNIGDTFLKGKKECVVVAIAPTLPFAEYENKKERGVRE